MKKFYILDGSGYIFRAYYALPELANSQGQPRGAVYGFFRMILKLFQDQPDNFVIAWDAKGKTKRHDMFEEYKANRPSMPDEFKQQISIIKDSVKYLGIPFLEKAGYEADDIIKTLVDQYGYGENEITIISGDKDLKQLLGKNIYFFDPMKQEVQSKDNFVNDMGFSPENMQDYLALLGDSSDNIPGVRGIGKKTAQKLISEYGTLEEIYENLNIIGGSLQTKLEESRELAFSSRELVELMTVDGMMDNFDLKLKPDFDKMKNLLVKEHGFKSMEKVVDELKKKYFGGKQESLF
ncbi:5'-3' exonuclease [Candidatus Absconditicoccus praedator]|uniref:5'-3' exonuclease n=1 Tax=Candidatus Absconditicoccus praedator TaxID=2735562 RepID=UPI001E4A112F|nr:5'-3' exonuclease H3TH domain-containing protein [Candidatus Absconditicoccus praedator]UFX83504.1 5'-3' exonuclease [Candidatus Absconditicoccus praedator]